MDIKEVALHIAMQVIGSQQKLNDNIPANKSIYEVPAERAAQIYVTVYKKIIDGIGEANAD